MIGDEVADTLLAEARASTGRAEMAGDGPQRLKMLGVLGNRRRLLDFALELEGHDS